MKRALLFLCAWWLLSQAAAGAWAADEPPSAGERGALELSRGSFELRWYGLKRTGALRGLVVVGSGDGGWSYWEERLCAHLARRGWAVAGIDFALYAESDYSQAVLAADYAKIVSELSARTAPAGGEAPVIYGGWSMGAEQALPAAADTATRPERLRGFLLVAPGDRGRYGLHLADKMGITPTGEGTFALADFAPALRGLKFVQLHAGLDPLDSITWSEDLGLQLRLFEYPRAFHDFSNASDDFLAMVDEALAWVLKVENPSGPSVPSKRSKK